MRFLSQNKGYLAPTLLLLYCSLLKKTGNKLANKTFSGDTSTLLGAFNYVQRLCMKISSVFYLFNPDPTNIITPQ